MRGRPPRAVYDRAVDAWAWWLIAVAVLALIEVLTLDLVFAMLAGGALAAAGIAGLDSATGGPFGFAAQVIVGLAAAVAGLALLRPVALRHLRSTPALRTGAAALVGADAVVLAEVGPSAGQVKLAGEVWSARCYDGTSVFAPGAGVSVLQIDGATALVG